MKPVIRSLTLRGFRSIASERVEFDNPTFFVGVNGSGKSNVLDALAFLADAMRPPLRSAIDIRGGLSNLCHRTDNPQGVNGFGLKVEIGRNRRIGHYSFEIGFSRQRSPYVNREQCQVANEAGEILWFDRDRDNFRSNVEGLALPIEPDALALPLIGGHKGFSKLFRLLFTIAVYSIDPNTLRRDRDAGAAGDLLGDGANTVNVLQELQDHSPETVGRISELLSSIMPSRVHVRPVQRGDRASLEFDQEWNGDGRITLSAAPMSDGTLLALGFLTAIFQPFPHSLIAIEEPENTIHPGALSLISDLLEFASKRSQVMVTTHSPELLDARWIQDRHLRAVYWQDGATHVAPVGRASREALQEHLMSPGELLRSNVLDAPPIHEHFEATPIFEAVPG